MEPSDGQVSLRSVTRDRGRPHISLELLTLFLAEFTTQSTADLLAHSCLAISQIDYPSFAGTVVGSRGVVVRTSDSQSRGPDSNPLVAGTVVGSRGLWLEHGTPNREDPVRTLLLLVQLWGAVGCG